MFIVVIFIHHGWMNVGLGYNHENSMANCWIPLFMEGRVDHMNTPIRINPLALQTTLGDGVHATSI